MFRLWVASTEYRQDITYSQGSSTVSRVVSQAAQHRAVLARQPEDFEPDKFDRSIVTLGVDRYMLARLDECVARARLAYEKYDLHVVHRLLVELVTVDVSALYSDVTKDRLYSDPVNSPARRAAQVVMYECLRADRDVGGADPVLHGRGHLEVHAAASAATRTACTSRCSPRRRSRTRSSRPTRGARRVARARDQGARAVPRGEAQVGWMRRSRCARRAIARCSTSIATSSRNLFIVSA